MFRFPCIGFLGLMNAVEGMESWAEHLLLCLSPTLVHRFDSIEVGVADDFPFVAFHWRTLLLLNDVRDDEELNICFDEGVHPIIFII